MKELSNPIFDQCRQALKSSRKSLLEAGASLYLIHTNSLWEGHFESFNACLDDLGVSPGTASKLMAIYERFCVVGRVSQRNLEGIDYEKLYYATKIPASPEEQLVYAQTLSRQELKQEVADKGGEEHEHTPITICSKCHARL